MAMSRKVSRKSERKSRKAERKSRRAERKTRKQEGGKKKRAPSAWNKAVKNVYQEMKRKDRNASFGDALKEASRRKKAGNL